MTDRKVMQQALEALDAYSWEQVGAARTALRARLAEPEPEPVVNGWTLREVLFEDGEPIAHREPPARSPLTDEEIDRITREKWGDMLFSDVMEVHREFARAVIAKAGGNDE